MTISQKIVQSLQRKSEASGCKEGEDEIFDLDEHLRSSSKKVLLQRISFVEAKQPYHFDLKKLKAKYVLLNPSRQTDNQKMSPALKVNAPVSNKETHDGIPTPKTVLFSGDKIELAWKRAMRAGAGLSNLGNTCFLNSSLQCLSYTAPLANYLINLDHRKHCRLNGQQFCMLCAMQQHLHHIHTNSGQAIKPMYILKNLRMIAKHLQFGRQEDAHEFIRYSVDAMQKSCLYGFSSKIDVHVKATTVIHQIFGGYLRSRVKCRQCKSVSDTYDPFLDLSLDINKQGCIDLQRCLEMFVQVEVLQGDNAYKCVYCKTTVQACKKFSIHRAPNVLMMQLKRFSNFMGSKINKELSYPSKLNIGPYMSNKPEGGLWYELYAVLVHSGFSCQSGHYYAYAKAPNGQWYCFNDSSVHQVSINQVLNQQAYLLFYSRSPKTNSQLGHFKSVHKQGVSSSNMKQFNNKSAVMNGNRDRDMAESHRPGPIIGPQLPPDFKSRKNYAFQSTSSSSDTGSPVAKNLNERKVTISPSSSISSNRAPLQFSFNRKPKLSKPEQNNNNNKLANGGGSLAHVTNSGNFSVNYNADRRKSDQNKTKSSEEKSRSSPSAPGTSSTWPTPILDKVMNSAEEGSLATSSKSMPNSLKSASAPKSSALLSLASYSSGEDGDTADDKEEKETQLPSASYSSISSTLKRLRESSSKNEQPMNKSPLNNSDSGQSSNSMGSDDSNKKTEKVKKSPSTDKGLKGLLSAPLKEEKTRKEEKPTSKEKKSGQETVTNGEKITETQPKRTDFSSPTAAMLALSKQTSGRVGGYAPPPVMQSSSLRKLLSVSRVPPQREPILHLLSNEINSDDTSKKTDKDVPAANATKNNEDEDKLEGKRKPDDSSGGRFSTERSMGEEDRLHEKTAENHHRKKYDHEKHRERHKEKKERKRHYSTESGVSSPESSKKQKHSRSTSSKREASRSASPARNDREHLSTPTKKRKREKSHSRHREYGEKNSKANDKHEKRRSLTSSGTTDTDSSNFSPKKKKKHFYTNKESKNSVENNRQKTNGHSDHSERNSSVDDLYCESSFYEEIRRKKVKKEKKKRMRERQILQNSIDEELESDSSGKHQELANRKETAGKKKYPVKYTDSDDCTHDELSEIDSPMKPKSHSSRENVYKWDQKRDQKSTHTPTKERPNILAQLLKQSSGKAYGTKVDTWNGDDSLVEKDARETWKEQRTPLTDEWDREYDQGKTKKVKKKNPEEKYGRMHNLFQKFQNMKNQKNGVGP